MAVPGPSLNERLIKMLERLHQNESCPNLSLEGLLDTATQHLQTSEATHEDLKRALDDYGRLLVSMEDFDHISKIGSGKFGSTIHLVREKLSSRLHALKSLPRSRIEFQKGGVGLDHVCTERTILASANNQVQQEWIPKLRFAFQCQESLHMVMDYFPGGDLKTLLRR